MRARRGLFICAGAAVALSCMSDQPSGRTSVYLTIDNDPGAVVPDELRLTAMGDGGSVFADERLPPSGPLAPPDGGTLGTVTLYVRDGAGDLRIEVRGLLAGVPRSRGSTTVRVVEGRQVMARVLL